MAGGPPITPPGGPPVPPVDEGEEPLPQPPGGRPDVPGRVFPVAQGGGPPQRVWDIVEMATMRAMFRSGFRPLQKAWTVREIRRDKLAQKMLNRGLLSTEISGDSRSGNVTAHPTDRLRGFMWRHFSIPG